MKLSLTILKLVTIDMLRDNQTKYCSPNATDLSVDTQHEINLILSFIDRNIPEFIPFFQKNKDSEYENRISDFLVHFLNCCLRNCIYAGFPPFNFGKNPTQAHSTQETDIGVVVQTKETKPVTIIEFESKRFAQAAHNKEYVFGQRGGIERFKKGDHASHLSVCGMFGFVQSGTSAEWISKVNGWIVELSTISASDLIWSDHLEQLQTLESFDGIEKLKSRHIRVTPLNPLTIYHYFIKLN